MNGYFRLVTNETHTGIQLFPPTDNGKPIDFNELTGYLQRNGIEDYNLPQLNKLVVNLKEPITVPLVDTAIFPVSESFSTFLSEDRLIATVRFYPFSNGGSALTYNDILNGLKQRKIIYGIDEVAIQVFLGNKQYCTDLVVAKGTKPIQGTDAEIKYFFNTDTQVRPVLKEDGTVDFFNLNMINHCKKDEVLAKLTPAVPSIPGKTVFGELIKGRDVKQRHLHHGRNIRLSKDQLELSSMVNGHVSLVNDEVFVSDVYEVDDVSLATGNIESEGSVLVNGNVKSGFVITAESNVEVRGLVEGATIEAGGDIIIRGGMNGMGKGKLKAGGRIISKFFENTVVDAGEYVEAEDILHSKINAGTQINVNGKKGIIVGGTVRATNHISCKILGSHLGASTTIEVGADPNVKERYNEVQKKIVTLQKKYKEEIVPQLSSMTEKLKKGIKFNTEQLKHLQVLAIEEKKVKQELAELTEEHNEIQEKLKDKVNSYVEVSGEAFQGTMITISDATLVLRDSRKYCRFVNDGGTVRMSSL